MRSPGRKIGSSPRADTRPDRAFSCLRFMVRVPLSGVRYFAELGLRDKTVAIGHLDLRQGRRVEHPVLGQDSVQTQDIGGNRIGVVDRERAGGLVGHGPVNVIEQRRRIGPVAAYGLDGGFRGKSALAASEAVLDAVLAVGPVTGLAS